MNAALFLSSMALPQRKAARKAEKALLGRNEKNDALAVIQQPLRSVVTGMLVDVLEDELAHRLWTGVVTRVKSTKVRVRYPDMDGDDREKWVKISLLRPAIERSSDRATPRCETGKTLVDPKFGEEDDNAACQMDNMASEEDPDDWKKRRKNTMPEKLPAGETHETEMARIDRACAILGLKRAKSWNFDDLEEEQEQRCKSIKDLRSRADDDGFLTLNTDTDDWNRLPKKERYAMTVVRAGRMVFVEKQKVKAPDGKMTTESFAGTIIGYHPKKKEFRVVNRETDPATPNNPFWLHQLSFADVREACNAGAMLERGQKRADAAGDERDVFGEAVAQAKLSDHVKAIQAAAAAAAAAIAAAPPAEAQEEEAQQEETPPAEAQQEAPPPHVGMDIDADADVEREEVANNEAELAELAERARARARAQAQAQARAQERERATPTVALADPGQGSSPSQAATPDLSGASWEAIWTSPSEAPAAPAAPASPAAPAAPAALATPPLETPLFMPGRNRERKRPVSELGLNGDEQEEKRRCDASHRYWAIQEMQQKVEVEAVRLQQMMRELASLKQRNPHVPPRG